MIVRIGATGAGALLALGLLTAPPAAADGSGRHGKSERPSQAEQSKSSGKAEQSKSSTKAAPSGKVTCFDAEGRTQGRSLSDPDKDANGGADKPGCDGGVNAADRDGNNGCGNDIDREDDNNGNCGGRKVKAPNVDADKVEKVDGEIKIRCQHKDHDGDDDSTPSTDASAEGTANGSCPKDGEESDGDSAVLGASDATLQASGLLPAELFAAAAATPETSVLGVSLTAPAPAGTAASTTTPDTQVLGETLSAPDTLARTGAGLGALALVGGLLVGGGRLTVLARRLLRIG